MPAELDAIVGPFMMSHKGMFSAASAENCQQILPGSCCGDGGEFDFGLALDPFRQDHQLCPVISAHKATFLGGDFGVTIAEDSLSGRNRGEQNNGNQQHDNQAVDDQATQGALDG